MSGIEDARQTILFFLQDSLEKKPGWDRKVEHAMLVLAGAGNPTDGRRLLAVLALAEAERSVRQTEAS
ncbi:hypothetical protein ACFFMP_00645 [Pseudoroseomonas cervicalis]|uniref:Uncharacterized protein n=1 Tax=Pseudoroseomonas cervicalis ATCC 49957 TaxID=525371 RepID=D5RIU3_9PROT|nr:hypothetical protein [Pseudoroseomonas cervicalis]EFH12765.1 hypothetical protein HMPREF0731_1003 [Pseudoroseomonas cervicalis ATCC 49957]